MLACIDRCDVIARVLRGQDLDGARQPWEDRGGNWPALGTPYGKAALPQRGAVGYIAHACAAAAHDLPYIKEYGVAQASKCD